MKKLYFPLTQTFATKDKRNAKESSACFPKCKRKKGEHKGLECLQTLKTNKALLRRISRPSAPGFSSHLGTWEWKAGKSQVASPRLM